MTPEAEPLYTATSSGGDSTVVNSVIMTATPKTSSERRPCVLPMPAMMSATSPRGTMPTPMRSAPSGLKAQSSEGSAQPTILARTATAV